MSDSLFGTLAKEISALLFPLQRAATVPGAFEGMLTELGALPGTDTSSLSTAIAAVLDVKNQLEALAEQSSPSLGSIASVLDASLRAFDAIRKLSDAGGPMAQLAGFGRDLADLLVGAWLTVLHPIAHQVAVLLTLIELGPDQALTPVQLQGDQPVRLPYRIDRFHLDRLPALLRDPVAVLRAEYVNALATADDANAMADKLFPRVLGLLRELGVPCRYGINPGDEAMLGDSAPLMAHALAVYLDHPLNGATDAEAGAVFSISSADRGDLGLVVSPFGTLTTTRQAGPFAIELKLTAGVDALAYGRHGLTLLASADTTEVTGSVTATLTPPDDGPGFVIGSPDGTRIEIGGARLAIDTSLSEARQALALSADVSSSTLVIAPGDGDGFLAEIVPAQGLRADFDLGLAWSSDKGLTLRGSAGLEADIPIALSVAGVSLSSMHLGLQASDGQVNAEVSASLSASIGPVRAVLDRIGITGALSFPQTGGNLGIADLDLGFKGPSGIGLSVDAQGVLTGGGFLFHDDAQQLYAGVMQLSLHEQITLKAFGLIATRMPDGSRGYSLIIFITAEGFRPIPLGLGFTLQGIGGMVAIHRDFDENALRESLKNDTLAALLFPRDPVGNAPAIIRALNTAFPALRGSYLVGLLARIGWFTPTLIQMDLALILQFGVRQRLLLLGRISSLLPSRDNDLVRLNLDVMGVLDFDQGTASMDGVLVDSRLVHKFALTGAMAMRARWSSGPGAGFVLAVGGFNPRFAPPAGVPPLDRITIALASGDNPRLTCEAYFALTSNTVQFGARADLYAAAYGFSVQGDVGFDVLLQIAPLHFIADFHASVQLKHGSSNLFSVSLAGALEGPRPLRVSGKASFSIFWCDFSVRFDQTLIDGEPPPPPLGVDVLAALKSALSTAQSWSTQLPPERTHGVALRTLTPGTTLILDPLGRLAVKQQVAPLNGGRDIEIYGGAPVIGDRRFQLAATVNGQPLQSTQTLRDAFAPAQFFSMSDDEKLAAPSFEQMDAGLVFGSDAVSFDATQLIAAPLEYEAIVIDAPLPEGAPLPSSQVYTLPPAQLAFHSLTGAAARAPVRRVGRARFRTADIAPAVSMAKPSWDIVPLDGGAPAPVDPSVRTWSEHLAVLNTLNRAGAQWQLVPSAELAP
jgi:hypothetical protein